MTKKLGKSESGGQKIEGNVDRGCVQEVTRRLEKIGVVSNSAAPFLSIMVENEGQDGGPNLIKIGKKSIQNFMICLIGFWMRFGKDLGTKMI